MALIALEIPKVGLVMENARLVRWLKNVGDLVRQGEPLLELETEKSLVEIEATHSGRLKEILLPAESEAHVGDRVGWLESDAANEAPARIAEAASIEPADSRVRSSPVARRLAAQHGVDLQQVSGSGPRGRVQLADVRQLIDPRTPAAPAVQPLSSMRRAVARSMTLSNATVPQFTIERVFDCTALQRRREQLIAQLPPGTARPSVNDFLLQALAQTLLAVPALNATFSGESDSPEAALLPASGAHIGLVVAVENGLIVPVLHGVERFGLIELAQRRSEVVHRAQEGKLRREELEGATMSLSNLGSHGPDRFMALISPPQSAILAVGRQRDCVVVIKGGLHVRPLSNLTLTVDHRVADGRVASDFLNALVGILEGESWR